MSFRFSKRSKIALGALSVLVLAGVSFLIINQSKLKTQAAINPASGCPFQEVSAGASNSLAVGKLGTVWAWGRNSEGQLGDGTTTDRTYAVQTRDMTGVKQVAASVASYALKSDGTVWAWGYNGNGQLGDGSSSVEVGYKTLPKQVVNLKEITAITAGNDFALALQSNGTVWAWGANHFGQLGLGTAASERYSTPAQVSGLTDVKAIGAGNSFSFAVKNDGSLWAWGRNDYGQLGEPPVSDNSFITVPTQVDGISDVVSVSGGRAHSVALKSDGTVWAWGSNENEQLGRSDGLSNFPAPSQVQNLPLVSKIDAGDRISVALSKDGFVWAWGNNTEGAMGIGSHSSYNLPQQIGNQFEIKAITASSHILSLQNSGTIWGWGRNDVAQVDYKKENRYSPVRIIFCPLFSSAPSSYRSSVPHSPFPSSYHSSVPNSPLPSSIPTTTTTPTQTARPTL